MTPIASLAALNPKWFQSVVEHSTWMACIPERTFDGTEEQQDNGLWIKRCAPTQVSFDVCPELHEMVLGIPRNEPSPLANLYHRHICHHSGYDWYAVPQSWFFSLFTLEPR